MKVIWLILFYIISLVNINLAKYNDSSETKSLANNNSVKIIGSVADKKEISFNKENHFIVTRKPTINYHHKKNKRQKYTKNKLSKHATKPKYPTNRSKMYKRKHKFETKANENIRKIFQDKIAKIDVSDENESKENKAIICKGLQLKRLLDSTYNATTKGASYITKHGPRNYQLNDTSIKKLRKCLSKLKKHKSSASSEEDNKGRKDKIDNKTLNALEHLLENMNKSVIDEVKIKKTHSAEEHKERLNLTSTTEKSTKSSSTLSKEVKTDKKEDTDGVSRLKRSVNIIEEESIATTSADLSFTGRDLSINHQFTYRNIHY